MIKDLSPVDQKAVARLLIEISTLTMAENDISSLRKTFDLLNRLSKEIGIPLSIINQVLQERLRDFESKSLIEHLFVFKNISNGNKLEAFLTMLKLIKNGDVWTARTQFAFINLRNEAGLNIQAEDIADIELRAFYRALLSL